MLPLLKEKCLEVIRAVAPLVLVVCVLQFTLVQAPAALFLQFLIGSLMAIGGMALFFIGIDVGILPMGKIIGSKLPQKGSLKIILAVAFSLGFATTVAEPDVLVLANQVDALSLGAIPKNAVLYAMAVGLAIFASVAMLRIVHGFPMVFMLAAAYALIVVLSLFTPAEFVPLAFDAGSVTTGALTSPVLLSLALGLSSVVAGRSAVSDGFGVLGFASIGPIIAIMIMGIWFH